MYLIHLLNKKNKVLFASQMLHRNGKKYLDLAWIYGTYMDHIWGWLAYLVAGWTRIHPQLPTSLPVNPWENSFDSTPSRTSVSWKRNVERQACVFFFQRGGLLVGGYNQPLLKNMQKSNWGIIFPNFRGENSKNYLSCHQPDYTLENTLKTDLTIGKTTIFYISIRIHGTGTHTIHVWYVYLPTFTVKINQM